MWAEFCDIYLEDKIDKRLEIDTVNEVPKKLTERYKEESKDEGLDFLEAIEYMKQGRICNDFNGHSYKIVNDEFYHQLNNNWIKCWNYEIPTASRWYLVD